MVLLMAVNGGRLGILMDPIEEIAPYKDSTLAIAQAAQDVGWTVEYFTQGDIWLDEGIPKLRSASLKLDLANDNHFEGGEFVLRESTEFDCLVMRKDPPFDMNYIYSTYFLEMAERLGVLVVNSPQSLRDCNEKLFATQFPQCCPELVVSSSDTVLRDFHRRYGDVIIKPLDGMGGQSIFRLKPDESNLSVVIETITNSGSTPVMAQRYLPEIKQGDKRILMIDGEPVSHALARIPHSGETRGNLAAGGTGVVQELSERDLWIAGQVGPELRERGLLLVGLDVIGDFLTEINVTSPTCIREIDAVTGEKIGNLLMQAIEEKRSSGSASS
jgi:glutathione synthase